ncbi:MAG: LON peptidase substrate-binding domain-containing protein [Candidatus Obscuribacterales bacterium]
MDTLSLFPLPVVQFPNAFLPLHIFEERYKAMINDAIEADEPFGVVYCDRDSSNYAETGCSTRITRLARLPGGRMNILTLGEKRFRILAVLKHKPYLVAQVEYFDDRVKKRGCKTLVTELHAVLEHILHLSSKLVDKEVSLENEIPSDPQELSFWIASNFYGYAGDQQELLEMDSTRTRLEEELAVLDATRKNLAARASIKDAVG